MNLTKDKVRQIRHEMNLAIAEVLKDHGLEGSLGNIKFTTDGEITFQKFTATPANKELKVVDKRALFEELAPVFGVKREAFGKIINWGGRDFKVIGLNTRRPKFCVEVIAVGNHNFKNPERLLPRGALDLLK